MTSEEEYQVAMDTFEKRVLGDKARNILAKERVKEHFKQNFGEPCLVALVWLILWAVSPFVMLAYWGKWLWGKCVR